MLKDCGNESTVSHFYSLANFSTSSDGQTLKLQLILSLFSTPPVHLCISKEADSH